MKRIDNHAESHGQKAFISELELLKTFRRSLFRKYHCLLESQLIAWIRVFDLKILDKIRTVPGLSKKVLKHTKLEWTYK